MEKIKTIWNKAKKYLKIRYLLLLACLCGLGHFIIMSLSVPGVWEAYYNDQYIYVYFTKDTYTTFSSYKPISQLTIEEKSNIEKTHGRYSKRPFYIRTDANGYFARFNYKVFNHTLRLHILNHEVGAYVETKKSDPDYDLILDVVHGNL